MNNQVQKNRFLKDFLVVSSKDGWNLNVFNKVKKKLKYSSTLINKLFPKKLEDLILFYNVAINQELSKIYKKRKFDKKKRIRISILNAVKTRFELMEKNKETIKKSLLLFSNPSYQILSSKLIYNTVDHIWKLIGDKSSDYNFYTKRAILASIYSFAFFIWINDRSKNLDKTFNFLEKSIMNMNLVTTVKNRLKKTINQFL